MSICNVSVLPGFNHPPLFRSQSLDTVVLKREHKLPVVNLKGDVLFNTWESIFNGQGGLFSQTPRIFSFNGKNVMNDLTW